MAHDVKRDVTVRSVRHLGEGSQQYRGPASLFPMTQVVIPRSGRTIIPLTVSSWWACRLSPACFCSHKTCHDQHPHSKHVCWIHTYVRNKCSHMLMWMSKSQIEWISDSRGVQLTREWHLQQLRRCVSCVSEVFFSFLNAIGNSTIKETNFLCKAYLLKTDIKELVGVRGKRNILHTNRVVISGQKHRKKAKWNEILISIENSQPTPWALRQLPVPSLQNMCNDEV